MLFTLGKVKLIVSLNNYVLISLHHLANLDCQNVTVKFKPSYKHDHQV